jgi:hypothetical protein
MVRDKTGGNPGPYAQLSIRLGVPRMIPVGSLSV